MAATESSIRNRSRAVFQPILMAFPPQLIPMRAWMEGSAPNPNISTSNPWGGVYAQITGNKNGGYQQIGNGLGSVFRSRPSPYVQQWMFGMQYAFTPNDLARGELHWEPRCSYDWEL